MEGYGGDTYLEDEHFEVVASQELGVVFLQSLLFDTLPLEALPDSPLVSSDLARVL